MNTIDLFRKLIVTEPYPKGMPIYESLPYCDDCGWSNNMGNCLNHEQTWEVKKSKKCWISKEKGKWLKEGQKIENKNW